MRTVAAVGVLLALAAGPTFPTAAPSLDPALAETWKKFNAAFNRFDPKEVAAFWETDGTLIGPTGLRGNGRAGVESVFASDVDKILRGTTSTMTVQTVRMLGKDLAFLDLEHAIEGARMPDGSTGTMRLHLVVLARRHGKTWQWVDTRPYAFLPTPPGAPPAK
jgi:uncharacterized protein (TIGR02246 family)